MLKELGIVINKYIDHQLFKKTLMDNKKTQ